MLNDPNAFANKIEVHLSVMHLNALNSIALYWGVFFGALTMLLGMALLLGSFIQLNAWLVAGYALLSTCLTGYISINQLMVEMPSFGEMLHWSPLAAFYRDIFLLVLSVFLLLGKHQIEPLAGFKWNIFLLILAAAIVLIIPYYTLTQHPFYSKLPLKKGLDMRSKWALSPSAPKDSFATFFYYYNLKKQQLDSFGVNEIGEHLRELSNKKKYLFEKSATLLVRKGAVPNEAGFQLFDLAGRAVQDSILNEKGLSIWVVFRNTSNMPETTQRKLNLAIKSAEEAKIPIIGISVLSALQANELRHNYNWALPFFQCPNAEFIRQLAPQNPSIILVHDGKVQNFWCGTSIPTSFSSIE